MQAFRNIANKIAGLHFNEEQKVNLLREALESKNMDLIEAALSKGAKPRTREIRLRLTMDDCPPTKKQFIEIFRKLGGNLNETTEAFPDGFGLHQRCLSNRAIF